MLKLIKFEMIHSYRNFIRVFAGYLIACVILPFLPMEISVVGTTIIVFATFGISIAVFVTIIINFNNSMYKKPGYLTLTLPVTSHQLIISKVISTFIWLVITGIILFLGLFALILLIMTKEYGAMGIVIGEVFSELVYLTRTGFEFAGAEIIIGLLQMFTTTISSIMGIFALITVIQTKYTRKNKTLWAFVIFFIYTFVISYLNTMLLDNFVYELMNLNYYLIAMSIVESVVFYSITIYVLNHQIELE